VTEIEKFAPTAVASDGEFLDRTTSWLSNEFLRLAPAAFH